MVLVLLLTIFSGVRVLRKAGKKAVIPKRFIRKVRSVSGLVPAVLPAAVDAQQSIATEQLISQEA